MVWSQYVYEATTGFETSQASDDEDFTDETPLNVEDWQVQYSEELWYMWDTMNTLLYDAYIQHTGTFSDFAEFCYNEHTDDCDFVWIPYESQLSYIWRHIQDFLEDMDLHNEFMYGATFDHWVRFAFQHTGQNNLTI